MTKLNKQGVRDLNAVGKKAVPTPGSFIAGPGTSEEFGKHQLPGELAAKLLSEQPAEFGAQLDPQVQEFLHILAEECAETVQRVTKILRFGMRRNPWDGKDNIERLESEIGDIHAAATVLVCLDVLNPDRIHAHAFRKLSAFVVEESPAKPRLRHADDRLRAVLQRILEEM